MLLLSFLQQEESRGDDHKVGEGPHPCLMDWTGWRGEKSSRAAPDGMGVLHPVGKQALGPPLPGLDSVPGGTRYTLVE